MGYRFDVFVGSDNSSRRITKDYLRRIVKWANSVFPEGYTLTRGRGYYEGEHEESLVLSVLTDGDIELKDKVALLKRELKQKSILVSKYTVQLAAV